MKVVCSVDLDKGQSVLVSFAAPASAGTKRDFTPKFHLAFDGSCWSVFTSLSLIKAKNKIPLCVVGVRVRVGGVMSM